VDETHAKAISDGLKEIDLQHEATKDDIHSVREDLRELKSSLLQWFTGILLAHAALVAGFVKLLM